MSKIALNASMRTNLLSLEQTAKLQSRTQLRLSTGLKVNSAIDNPSSYYTANALSNRADDLSALLDAMGQGVQTIKAASEGIKKAEAMLDIAQASAEAALENLEIPSVEYFQNIIGDNGTVVTTAEELIDAINSGVNEICVYGHIDMGNKLINLKANQKLVGIGYYGNFDSDTDKFSSLTYSDARTLSYNFITIDKGNNVLADLSINVNKDGGGNSIMINNCSDVLISNIDINSNTNGIQIQYSATNIKLDGKNYLNLSGKSTISAISSTSSTFSIYGETTIKNLGTLYQYGLNGCADIYGKMNIYTSGTWGFPLSTTARTINLKSTAEINMMGYMQSAVLQSSPSGNIYIEAGAKLNYQNQGCFVAMSDMNIVGKTSGGHIFLDASYIRKYLPDFTETAYCWQDIDFEGDSGGIKGKVQEKYLANYNQNLSQYDTIIKDSSYKGTNLLQADALKVIFNEDRSSNLLIQGIDVSSYNIDLQSADWLVVEDVQQSLQQLIAARNKLRSVAMQLGNYYGIITERQDFTENLINVLEEGADKLTLADMNEEAAQELALVIRRQLATNSLSLASQASQSVLTLF